MQHIPPSPPLPSDNFCNETRTIISFQCFVDVFTDLYVLRRLLFAIFLSLFSASPFYDLFFFFKVSPSCSLFYGDYFVCLFLFWTLNTQNTHTFATQKIAPFYSNSLNEVKRKKKPPNIKDEPRACLCFSPAIHLFSLFPHHPYPISFLLSSRVIYANPLMTLRKIWPMI